MINTPRKNGYSFKYGTLFYVPFSHATWVFLKLSFVYTFMLLIFTNFQHIFQSVTQNLFYYKPCS